MAKRFPGPAWKKACGLTYNLNDKHLTNSPSRLPTFNMAVTCECGKTLFTVGNLHEFEHPRYLLVHCRLAALDLAEFPPVFKMQCSQKTELFTKLYVIWCEGGRTPCIYITFPYDCFFIKEGIPNTGTLAVLSSWSET